MYPTHQTGLKKVLSKIKTIVPQTYVINDFNGKEIIETFYEKNYKRLIKKNNSEQKK